MNEKKYLVSIMGSLHEQIEVESFVSYEQMLQLIKIFAADYLVVIRER